MMQEISRSLDDANKVLKQIEKVLEVVRKLEHDANYIKPKFEDLENQLTEFAELAGLGLTAEALSHEISHIVDRMLVHTNDISKTIKDRKTVDAYPVTLFVEQVKSSIKSFRKQLSHLAPSLRYVRESKEDFFITQHLKELISFYQDRFDGKIKIVTTYDKDFRIKMSKGKLTQVMDNIILNSEYWLGEYKKIDKEFGPLIRIEVDEPMVRIYDNGMGIDPSYNQRIFQPFVTTKPKNVGRGMGLFIVQQLLDSIGCEIILLDKQNEHGRRFVFQIDLSNVMS